MLVNIICILLLLQLPCEGLRSVTSAIYKTGLNSEVYRLGKLRATATGNRNVDWQQQQQQQQQQDDFDYGLDKVAALKRWLEDHGAFISSNVAVEKIPGMGFGVQAAGKINPYDVVVSIPRERCLSALGPTAIDDIALRLCQERLLGPRSEWWPYIDVLPKDVSFLPCMWPVDDLELIAGTSIYVDAVTMKQSWIDSYNKMVAATGSTDIDLDTWCWARAMVQSRGYSFRTDNKEEKIVPTVARHPALLAADAAEAADDDASGGRSARARKVEAPQQHRGSALVAALMGVPDVQQPDANSPQLTVMFPFIDLVNHDDHKHSTVTTGNGIEFPETSIVLKSRHRYYPGNPVYITYGDLSFQQKALSFGWIDQSYKKGEVQKVVGEATEYTDNSEGGAHCITPIDIPPEVIAPYSRSRIGSSGGGSSSRGAQVEIKTRISMHRRTGGSSGQHSKKHLGEFNEEMAKAIKTVDDVTLNSVVTIALLRNALHERFYRALRVEAISTAELWLESLAADGEENEDTIHEDMAATAQAHPRYQEAIYIAQMEMDAVELILSYFDS